MLRVIIELVPFGDETRKKKIGEMVIANDTENYDESGDSYQAWTAKDDWSGESEMFGRLSGYDRRQSPWELVRLVIETIRLEKNKPDTEENSLSQRLLRRLKGEK